MQWRDANFILMKASEASRRHVLIRRVDTRLIKADNLQRKACCWPLLQKIVKHNVCNNNDFTVQTVSETCVQWIRHSNPRHTANDVSIIRYCNQWSAVAVCATLSRLPALTDQRCQTSYRGKVTPATCMALKWRKPPSLNVSCWGHNVVSGSMQATFSRRRYAIEFDAMCDGALYCCRVHTWRRLASYAFIKIKLASKFYRYI